MASSKKSCHRISAADLATLTVYDRHLILGAIIGIPEILEELHSRLVRSGSDRPCRLARRRSRTPVDHDIRYHGDCAP